MAHVCWRCQLHHALYSLYSLLMEACPTRTSTMEEDKVETVSDHAKYYYASLHDDESQEEEQQMKEKKNKLPYPAYHFDQLIDTPRLQYGLSLLSSLFSVHAKAVCSALVSSQNHTPLLSSLETKTTEKDSTDHVNITSSVSMLQRIVSFCAELLLSKYPGWLNVTTADQLVWAWPDHCVSRWSGNTYID